MTPNVAEDYWVSFWEYPFYTHTMMKTNSYLQSKNYFDELVQKHKKINEFIGFFNRELHEKQGSFDGIASPYLALFKYEAGLDGPEQNTIAVRKVAFALMRTDVATDDFDAQYQAVDECEKLALSVLARIRYDSNNRNHFLYNSFLKESVRILPVELSSQSYGVEVYFNLKNPQPLIVNPDEWSDIDEVCS